MPDLSNVYTTRDVIVVPYFPNEENPKRGTVRWVLCIEDLNQQVKAIAIKKIRDPEHLKHEMESHPNAIYIRKESKYGKTMRLEYDSLFIPERIAELDKIAVWVKGKCPQDLFDRIIKVI